MTPFQFFLYFVAGAAGLFVVGLVSLVLMLLFFICIGGKPASSAATASPKT